MIGDTACAALYALILLPGSFAHAGYLPFIGKLSEADAAYAVFAKISVGTSADLAAVVSAGRKLRRCLLF